MTNSEQSIREKAINIFADIFTAGGEAHEVGGQSFDQLQQSGYIDRKITDLTALIAEHYYPKEFLLWAINDCRWDGVFLNLYDQTGIIYQFETTDELFNYWEENER